MSLSTEMKPRFRELAEDEHTAFFNHMLRLGPISRHMRFGYAVGDLFLKNYCLSVGRLNIVTFGAFVGGELRAVAELRRVSDLCPADGEIGLTVEDDWQDAGIGTELLSRVQDAARQRGIETIHMICSRENYRMRSVAHKVRARVEPLPNRVPGWDTDATRNDPELPADQPNAYSDFVTFSLDVGTTAH